MAGPPLNCLLPSALELALSLCLGLSSGIPFLSSGSRCPADSREEQVLEVFPFFLILLLHQKASIMLPASEVGEDLSGIS